MAWFYRLSFLKRLLIAVAVAIVISFVIDVTGVFKHGGWLGGVLVVVGTAIAGWPEIGKDVRSITQRGRG